MTAGCGRHDDVSGLRVTPGRLAPDREAVADLSYSTIHDVAQTTVKLLRDEAVNDTNLASPSSDSAAVYIALRANGRKLAEAWASEATLPQSLAVAAATARSRTPKAGDFDSIELVLAHNFRPFRPDRDRQPISNAHRGVTGLELTYRERLFMLSPTRMIAENKSFANYIDALNKRWGLSDEELETEVRFRTFEAQQFLISVEPTIRIKRMFRGNQLIAHEAVNRTNVAAMAERLGTWVVQNVHPDGRMTYLYRPGHGEDENRNNMLRQWMATVSLMQITAQRREPDLVRIANSNMRYNLDRFYRLENDLGYIEFSDKAKLGAMAIATLAIMSSPNRDEFSAQEAALRRTIDFLWNTDGSFRTFYKPAGRNDVQNFYPGETLLVWAFLYQESHDASLLQKIMKSYEYYRDWHLKDRNPAFVPWHTQAYYLVWQETGDESLADWVFEMNDWLLGMQQNHGWLYPDTDGRFYDPARPFFGPPHASSTAVYLEGLIDAFALARALEDTARAEGYRVAIVRGLRSLLQLEFADQIDMFYVSESDKVRGGMRTTVYDNRIRVDNVQHTLMALQKILAVFSDSDFAL